MLPPPVIEPHGPGLVARDDLLPGGTKRRALPPLLSAGGEFVYAGPAYGYAQIALAHACRDAGCAATVFTALRRQPHGRTLAAARAGAKVVQVPTGYLSNVAAKARAYCERTGATLLPFGLDCPAFIEALAAVARPVANPAEVWCVAGSGTLTRALQLAWPGARHYAVRVGKEPRAGAATVLEAPERFEDDAEELPPFPSCGNYDAKGWRFFRRRATAGALFWNVGA